MLNKSARRLRAREIIAESGADKPETLRASLVSVFTTTFRQQSETWLRTMRKRDVAPSTLSDWERCLDTWILPTIGDLSLAAIKRTVAQDLIDKMVAGKLAPKSISNYFQVLRMVFSSCVDEDGMELYPRNWRKMGLVIPEVNKRKQRRPSFARETMNHLANSPTIGRKLKMLSILSGATGLRFGEALGISIEKVLDSGSRIVIDQKAWRGEIHDFLKTPNGEREIDLPSNVAKLLVEFIGDRKAGLLFCTPSGKQLNQRSVLRRLHAALEEIGVEKAGGHAFRRFRSTYLRNHTACPQSLINFWLAWGDEDMSAHYDKIRADVSFRKEVAERCGVGFDVPDHLNLIEPKNEEEAVEVSA
jgi:integrase